MQVKDEDRSGNLTLTINVPILNVKLNLNPVRLRGYKTTNSRFPLKIQV